MLDIYQHLITIFLGYFAIMNPLANTTVFVGLTANLSTKDKSKVAVKTLITTFIIIVLFVFLGKTLFHFFGISLPAFRIAGGVLVSLIGYHMLHGESSSLHKGSDASADDIATSPLAVPILAGPGTIATTISYSASGGWLESGATIFVFLILCIITYVCFISGERILKILGTNALNIVTRLMGLILTVIGVQMLLEGVAGAIAMYQ